MKNSRLRELLVFVVCSLMFVLSFGMMGQSVSAQQYNLFKEIISHKDAIQWRTSSPTLPSDVCDLLLVCTGEKATPKAVTLPPATIDGRQVGRGLFLTQIKDPGHPALILEHQTRSEVYFFLLSPDGNLQKAVYLEKGKSFVLVANELAQPTFARDQKDWHDWALKIGSAAPHEHGQ